MKMRGGADIETPFAPSLTSTHNPPTRYAQFRVISTVPKKNKINKLKKQQ